MGIPPSAAWVVVFTAVASDGLRKCCPAVVGVLCLLEDTPFDIVIWVSLRNAIDGMVNSAERKKS